MKTAVFSLGSMQTNCYFLIPDNSNKCIIVDPAADFERIEEKLKLRNLTPETVIITHGHFDHIMALSELRDKYDVEVLIHELDNELIIDPNKSLMKFYTGNAVGEKSADRLLHDGDIIEFHGTKIEVMHTPGHTPGSCCFIFERTMICGDTIFRGNIGRYDFFGGDYESMMRSVERIKNLSGDYKILPGHGASSKLSYERENNIYMR